MAVASDFLIGANDEHGLNPPTAGKRTPIISYIGRSFYENECINSGWSVRELKRQIDSSLFERLLLSKFH